MHRMAIAFSCDRQGCVDEYFTFLLSSLRSYVARIVFVSDGPLEKHSEKSVASLVEELLITKVEGVDVWKYKAAIEHIGYQAIMDYDEVLLLDDTFYGPIFPFGEMFVEMESRSCDFWGIIPYRRLNPNPSRGGGVASFQLDSCFVAIRKSIVESRAFRFYWESTPPIKSCSDADDRVGFTRFFTDLGYTASTYLDPEKYGSRDPAYFDVDETLLGRSPILKRRVFLSDPICGELGGSDLSRALRIIKERSKYDLNLIWRNVLRMAELRKLNTNAVLFRILPDIRLRRKTRQNIGRIAVCAHVYYVELLGEIFGYIKNIRDEYDLIITTDTPEKEEEITAACRNLSGVGKIIVRVVEQNRGRDMAALFITCRDLFLDGSYALVCRLHTKKTPQVENARSSIFKRHMFENLLGSEGYVENVFDLFDENPALGLAIPPIVHISFQTFGHVWYSNRERAEQVASKLGLNSAFDEHTPVAPYGTMFWFRPVALRKLFEHRWDWEDFNEEPNHVDGSLAHVLERLVAYVAQDAKYVTFHIATAHSAEQNYTMLEWKLQALMASLPNGDINQTRSLISERAAQLAVIQARLADSEAHRAETEGRLAETGVQLMETESRLVETGVRLVETEGRLAETGARLVETGARLVETEARLVETEAGRAEVEVRLVNTLASHSWRATAFLRWVSRMIYWRS